MHDILLDFATKVIHHGMQKKIHISTAESCTGGMVSMYLTAVPGSSQVFDSGYITYSNRAKITTLNIPSYVIKHHGAVSGEVALLMAQNTLLQTNTTLAVGITGIAGPSGNTPKKPIGTVYISCVTKNQQLVELYYFTGDRHDIRLQTTKKTFDIILKSMYTTLG
jgi:PncC family amidohydrolase